VLPLARSLCDFVYPALQFAAAKLLGA